MLFRSVFPPGFPPLPKPPGPPSSPGSGLPPALSSPEQRFREPTQPVQTTTAVQPGQGPTLEEIVRIAHEAGHSDVHLGVGEQPRYRARGEMLLTDWPVSTPEVFQAWLQEILTPHQIDSFTTQKEFDGSHAFPFVRVRINLLDSLRGPAMVLRLIPQTILTLDDLHLPEVLQELSSRPKGLVLVTGPTGSGKSTTLAAMIDWINTHQKIGRAHV